MCESHIDIASSFLVPWDQSWDHLEAVFDE